MPKTKFLFATTNASKLTRFKNFVQDFAEIVSPTDLNLPAIEVEENGSNEWENAKLKAQAYYQLAKIPTFALDTGLYIRDLSDDQQPGKDVKNSAGVLPGDSKQIAFKKMTDYYINIAEKLGGTAEAYFEDVFCLYNGQDFHRNQAIRAITITTKIFQEDLNFPICSLYKVLQFDKYYHELNQQEMDQFIKPSQLALQELLTSFKG